jgi:CheY-like chemotaxis protein
MGLSIIHGLVHKNNGHLEVISEPNVGTSFTLLFKLATEKRNQEQQNNNVHNFIPLRRSEDTLDKRPIMVVDDNVQLLKFMKRFLQNHGYIVEDFESPTKALTTFIQNNGDYLLVISDYIMPKLSGAQLCKAILKYKPSTHIIICSGYNDDLYNEANAIDGVTYMAKPIEHNALLEKISQFGLKDLN